MSLTYLTNSVRLAYVYSMHYAEKKGIESGAISNLLNFSDHWLEELDEDTLLELFPKFLQGLVLLLDEDDLGFRLGKNFHLCLIGLGGLVASHAPTVAAALEILEQLSHYPTSHFKISRIANAEHSELIFEANDTWAGAMASQFSECWAAAYVASARSLMGGHLAPKFVQFAHPAGSSMAAKEAYFGCPVAYDAPQTVVCLGHLELHRSSPLHEPLLYEQLSFAAGMLEERPHRGAPTVELVGQSIRRGRFTLNEVARELGMSPRTIQRRLNTEGTEFRTLVDDIRTRMAHVYLRSGSLTVAEVAQRLGFSDARSFRAAYRRWTGRAPRDLQASEIG
ncbi:AraC family transcriptional regulator [Aureliella helgolandensis]|nr:AraC family transcriptional regulator [Aureliella helgolandensis]